MQPKTIKTPFNKDNFLNSQRTIWTFSNKKRIKLYIIFTIWAVLLIFIYRTPNKNTTDSIGSGIVYGYVFYMILYWVGFYERKIRFFKKSRTCATRFEKESMECTFTLNEHELEYQDLEKTYKLNWSLFNPYIVFKETILLMAKDSGGIIFTLSRKELGETDYQDVCNILNDKIGRA